MSELPFGWEWTTIGEIADVQLGRQRSPKNHNGPHMRPYLRSANVTWSGIDISDVKEMNFEPGEASTFELQPGDLLLNEASGSPNEVGKPAIWRGEIEGCCFQNTLLRVRPREVSTEYLYWCCRAAALSGRFGEAGRGVNIRHLGKQGLSAFPLALPPLPEQERIVAAIEEHLSRLDAAERAVGSARARLRQMVAKVKEAIITDAPLIPLADLALESRYGTSVKCDYVASGPGVIRIPNILDEAIHVDDLKFATDTGGVSAEVLLQEGDVVFVRTNGSRDLIGRAAVASGDAIGLGFASYLIRYRLRAHVDPRYLCAVVSAPSTRRALEGLAATTAGQYNLSVSKLDSVLVPLPSVEEQQRLVDARSEGLARTTRLANDLRAAERRSASLRRSILAAAFSGQLVPQDRGEEPACVLLERIRTKRSAATPTKRTQKVKAS